MHPRQLAVYRGCTPVVDVDATNDDSLAVTIVDAVAAAAGVEPQDLPPLFEDINPDAIDALFNDSDGFGMKGLLCFTVEQWNVFVSPSGRVRVSDATERTAEPEPIFATG